MSFLRSGNSTAQATKPQAASQPASSSTPCALQDAANNASSRALPARAHASPTRGDSGGTVTFCVEGAVTRTSHGSSASNWGENAHDGDATCQAARDACNNDTRTTGETDVVAGVSHGGVRRDIEDSDGEQERSQRSTAVGDGAMHSVCASGRLAETEVKEEAHFRHEVQAADGQDIHKTLGEEDDDERQTTCEVSDTGNRHDRHDGQDRNDRHDGQLDARHSGMLRKRAREEDNPPSAHQSDQDDQHEKGTPSKQAPSHLDSATVQTICSPAGTAAAPRQMCASEVRMRELMARGRTQAKSPASSGKDGGKKAKVAKVSAQGNIKNFFVKKDQ
jgi:hypothetical protein